MPAASFVLEQVKSCGSVSWLINMEPSELLRLQPSESIASESVVYIVCILIMEIKRTNIALSERKNVGHFLSINAHNSFQYLHSKSKETQNGKYLFFLV